jgi:hypothetical protein
MQGNPVSAADPSETRVSALLAVFADGAGDLSYGSPEWVEALGEALTAEAAKHAEALSDLGEFTFCAVAHNAPAFLHTGNTVAYNVKFVGSTVEARVGELPADACDYKVEGDHSLMSNRARIQRHGNDPALIAKAEARLNTVGKWVITGAPSEHAALQAVARSASDTMAVRTLPRFVWMSPEWVESARRLLSARAEEFADEIVDGEFLFNEVFTHPPAFAFPEGGDSGFWVRLSHGEVTVGYGVAPEEFGNVNYYNQVKFTPVVPVGRTVEAAMTDAEKEEKAAYRKVAFGVDMGENKPLRTLEKKPFPPGLSKVFGDLHDDLSLRSSGELPADYDKSVREEWAKPYAFDRDPAYDPSWLLYDTFDIYGNPR